ncbi:MAG: DUF4192 domain-containing protein [Pseudonocardia sp.]|uniref:DUF4192 domain-containing protein n=1 Tax=Pseudonocardia sp. TaxID=60912 RepID=UPI001AD07B4C|nr:DUF4192 domain-containing protein [Pseudonocardia sp.]MBN9098981.1 DUF4192 domain-containing protein [Pseudonocardia sp.]
MRTTDPRPIDPPPIDPPPIDPPQVDPLRIGEPAELVAALPYLLGFHPRESLVLVATGGSSGRRLGLTVRVDLPPPDDVGAVAEAVVASLMLDDPAGAAVVVLSAGADPPARALVDHVVDHLGSRGLDVHTVMWAESATAGARWSCFDDPACCGGLVPDPAATAFAAAAVARGAVARADRADLEHQVAAADGARLARREAMIVDDAAVLPDRTAALAAVDAALRDAAAGRLVLDDEQVVALAAALSDVRVRDAAMLRGAGPMAAAAEHLWAALCRETPDPEAAEPAALLAVSALLRGDGALAHVALDRAERAWPGHRLTGLLRQVADAGIRPGVFRDCIGAEDVCVGSAG